MSYNKSPLAFDDVREAFEKALTSTRGVKILCASRGAAVVLRSRFNYFRKIHRCESRSIYTPDHPMWGKTPYDRLALRIPPKGADDQHILYIEHHSVENLEIEEIV